MATLSVEELHVDTFETEPGVDGGPVAYPKTNEDPNCWSPLCIPTAVGPRCDTATNPI